MRVREVSAWLYKHGWRGRAEGPCRARVGGFGPLWVCSFEISGGGIRRAEFWWKVGAEVTPFREPRSRAPLHLVARLRGRVEPAHV